MDTAEGDALIGAVICLSAQAAVTPEGWNEFFTLNRGIVLMHMTCIKDPSKSIFTMLDHGNGTEGKDVPPEYLQEPSPATLSIFKVYKGCLLLLRPHVRTQEERQYFNHLWSISEVLGTARLPEGKSPRIQTTYLLPHHSVSPYLLTLFATMSSLEDF